MKRPFDVYQPDERDEEHKARCGLDVSIVRGAICILAQYGVEYEIEY